VVERAAAEIRAHGDDEIASTAVEALPKVMSVLWPQTLVVEKTKPAALRIDVGVDLVDEVLVAQYATDLRSPTRNERHGWKPVARSQDRLRDCASAAVSCVETTQAASARSAIARLRTPATDLPSRLICVRVRPTRHPMSRRRMR
jgi:hypothetical protein